jgi:hypothetical protein
MEHTATRTSKNRVSRFAVMIADFCNKIGTNGRVEVGSRVSALSMTDTVEKGF